MKHASILLLTIGLCGFSFAACAEGDETTFGNKPGGTGGEGGNSSGGGGPITTSSSSSSSTSGSGSSSGNSSGGVCSAKCSSDADCQSNCSVPPVGINCCDIGTNTCYVSGATMCPSQGGSSSGSMY